jgi:hypothetical protein
MIRPICAVFAAVLATNAFAQSTIGFTYFGRAVYENDGTVEISVIRTGSLTGAASVDYSTTGGAVAAAGHYVPLNGTLTFGNGESEKTISLTVLDDNVAAEPSHTLELLLSNWVHSSGNQYYAYYLEIKDNEPALPPLTASFSDLTHAEGDGVTTPSITVSLNRAHDQTVTLAFRGYTPPNIDEYNGVYTRLASSVWFEPGETTKQVPLEIHGNNTYESVTKTFHFTPQPGLVPVNASDFDVTLTEDDPQATVSIADASVVEGSWGVSGVQVTLTTDVPVTGEVHWAMSDGTATQADIDYGPFGVYEPVRFLNSTTALLTVVGAYGDLKIESDETFVITITSAPDMIIGDSSATITIDNDDESLPSFQEDLVRVEAGTSASLTINFPAPAPAGSVSLSSSDASVKVPASIDVPEQAMSVTFDVDATDAVGPTVVTATLPGALGATQLSATVDAFRDSDLRFRGPRRIAFAGDTALASLTLDPPREEAVTVTLTASAGIIVPESVIVPPGGTAEFPFTSLAAGPGWITATYGQNSTSLEIEIAAPEIKSFAPELAPTIGGTAITLKGVGFSDGCTASFGGAAAQTTFVDAQTLIAKTPPHAAETVHVTVTCGVTPVTAPSEFRFANVRRRATRH